MRTWLGPYNVTMGKSEILAALPGLKADERRQVFQRLCELQDEDILQGVEPTADEKRVLDQALAEFERDGNAGTPWRQSLDQIRASDTP